MLRPNGGVILACTWTGDENVPILYTEVQEVEFQHQGHIGKGLGQIQKSKFGIAWSEQFESGALFHGTFDCLV